MAKRFRDRVRRDLRERLHVKQGGKCAECGRGIVMHPEELPRRHYCPWSPEIDHIDGDCTNNVPENHALVHKRCNVSKGNAERRRIPGTTQRAQPVAQPGRSGVQVQFQTQGEPDDPKVTSALEGEGEGEGEGGEEQTRVPGPTEQRRAREIAPWLNQIRNRECWQGSSLTAREYLMKFVDWLLEAFGENERLLYDRDLIVSCAAKTWISERVVENYFNRMVSSGGHLEFVTEGKDRYLVWKFERSRQGG